MENKSNKKDNYIDNFSKKLDEVKKYINNASSYYEAYASQAPVILNEVKKQYKEAQTTIDQVKAILEALADTQNDIAEIMQDEKTDTAVLSKRKK